MARGNPNIKELGKNTWFQKGKVQTHVKPMTNYDNICKRLGIESKIKYTKLELYAMCEALLTMSCNQLEKLAKDKRIPVILQNFAKAIVQATEGGSLGVIDTLLDRFFGKPTQEVVNIRKEVVPTADNLGDFTTEELSKMIAEKSAQN